MDKCEVVFCGFGKNGDKRLYVDAGTNLQELALGEDMKKFPKQCQRGTCGICTVTVIELDETPQTHEMDETEIETLEGIGVLNATKAAELKELKQSNKIRLACKYKVAGDILVKPYKG